MEDNDMFIVVIGDESDQTFPAPIQINEEILDEDEDVQDVEDVLKKAKELGELLNIDCQSLKEEPETSDLNLNVNRDFEYEFEDDYIPKSEEEDEEDISIIEDIDEDIDEKMKRSKTNRRRRLKPSQRWSYIQQLKSQFQELDDDEDLLVKCLVEIMKATKRPPPPMDYYVMNGIMFECIICKTHTESIPAAGRHYQEKHGERYLYCYACGANFRSTTNLYKHEKRCEASNISVVLQARALSLGRKGRSRPFIPTFTQVEPRSTKNLTKHEKRCEASIISMVLQASELSLGRKGLSKPCIPTFTEVEPRRYHCGECSASFLTKYSLQAHELLHRGLRPHRCPVCPCAYTSSTALSRHMKKHSDAQYICAHCDRSFHVKAALVVHLNTHLSEKKYPCPECPKRYAQKSALLLHERRVHLRLPPPAACRLCDNRYPRMSVLKEHMRKVHGMELMTRKMFLKKLPTLTETQLQQAKVILKEDVQDNDYYLSNQIR